MDLQAFVGLVRRRWWVVALVLGLSVVGTAASSQSKQKIYRSTARLYVSIPTAGGVVQQREAVGLTTQLLSSYAEVAQSQITTRLVAAALRGRINESEVRDKVEALALPSTLLIDVRATDPSAKFAAELANTTASALTKVIGTLGSNPAGGAKASVIDRATVSTQPISPTPVRDVMTGAFLGLALGAVAALSMDTLDRSIREPDEAAEALGVPCLAALPRQRRLAASPLSALSGAGSPMGEQYRVLRTALRYRDAPTRLRTILVTSAAAGDGKTTVASNLAIAFSQDGLKVILIDADLRRGRVAQLFDVAQTPGLSDVLLGRAGLRDALTSWGGDLRILPAGSPGVKPSEALGSQAMQTLLADAKALADVVIIDTAPVLPVTDAAVLSAMVDGTMIVARWGRTSQHAAVAVRQTLGSVGANIVGVVLNGDASGRSAKTYRQYASRPGPMNVGRVERGLASPQWNSRHSSACSAGAGGSSPWRSSSASPPEFSRQTRPPRCIAQRRGST